MSTQYPNFVGVNKYQTPQSIENKESWNNFPAGSPYASQVGPGRQMDRQDYEKYVIDIDAKRKEKFVKDLPISKLFEDMNAGGTVSDFVVTWSGLHKGTAQTELMPTMGLRTRDARGFDGVNWGATGAGAKSAISVANPNEIGGKLQWQRVYIKDASDSNIPKSSILLDDLGTGDAITFSSAKLHNAVADGAGVDGVVSGIVGEMKEAAPVIATNGEHIITLGIQRDSQDLNRNMDEYIRKWAMLLKTQGYTYKDDTVVSFDEETIATTENKGAYNSTATKAIEFTYAEGTSMIVHTVWDGITLKIQDRISPEPMKIIGVKKFVFSAAMDAFYIVLDLFESNIDNIKRLPDTTTSLNPGAMYVVADGQMTDEPGDYLPGQIFKATQGTVTTGAVVYPAWDGLLIEEINTSRYSTEAPANQLAGSRSHYNRMFAPGHGRSPMGWTKAFDRLETTLDANINAAAASANGSFDLTQIESSHSNIEHDGRNFVQIFRSKVWMKTREEQLNANVRHGRDAKKDEERAMRKFYKGIDMTMLFGKLDFNVAGNRYITSTHDAANLIPNTPAALFATTDEFTSNAYNLTKGFTGDYESKMSGLFDREVFPITWARLPFEMATEGFNPLHAADKGYGIIDYCEKVAKALSYGNADGNDRVFTVFISQTAINHMGLSYARSQTVLSDQGNVFGNEIKFSSAESKSNPNLKFDTYSYRASTGIVLNFVPTPTFDFTPKFKGSWSMLGKKYLDPKWLMLVVDKNNVNVSSHQAYPEQEFVGLQPNHNVNIELRGIQASRTLEMDNVEECLIIDMSPFESDVYLTN